ncbi:MAG: DUF6089 family protein [Flavobacteriaceae bacterium]|nr:DUF6089 family protein [Flavobacteriaceae bacterium]
MKKSLFLYVCLLATITSSAQINEIGIFFGGSNYIGEVGKSDYIAPKDISVGAIYKWNMSPQSAIRYSFTYSQISANNAKSSNVVLQNIPFKFTNTLKEFAIGFEFNFFKYNLNQFKFMHTPYVFLNIAALSFRIPPNQIASDFRAFQTSTNISFPFGIGYKVKIANRLGLNLETRFNYTGKDNLEGDQTNINALNFNNPNTKDWYVSTGISLVYAFGERTCFFGSF